MTSKNPFANDPTACDLYLAYIAHFENERAGHRSLTTNRQIVHALIAYKAAHPQLWTSGKMQAATDRIRRLAAQHCP
jgi:hypothetical protein